MTVEPWHLSLSEGIGLKCWELNCQKAQMSMYQQKHDENKLLYVWIKLRFIFCSIMKVFLFYHIIQLENKFTFLNISNFFLNYQLINVNLETIHSKLWNNFSVYNLILLIDWINIIRNNQIRFTKVITQLLLITYHTSRYFN